ncbi:putative prefoldin subunit 4 [Pyronema domesticum]|uniref:Prefoldin subunit 4 n=1 Tax=Pyronema omphalodes (strain CBS 100304) TaxID=1076935 RepID=U4L2U9_PYROM|nr:putative prefoldin subunit 4 [Pyronema domesticum]CCX04390.1 Similar to Prefoldin subunit 4; acc. no. P53900 [Pyronema omphalodes CBS 100304]
MDKRLLSKEDESATEVQVTRADQDKINAFSTLHQKQTALQEDLKTKRQDKEYVEEVKEELELADEDELVPYKVGDSFFLLPLEEVQELLQGDLDGADEKISEIEEQIDENKGVLDGLKVELYAKFGKAINLDV